jgi:pilus assembly protein CpaF
MAVHAQLAGAVQAVLQMRRAADGRVLQQVGVLRRRRDGLTEVIPAICEGRTVREGAEVLAGVLADRGADAPW